MLGYILHRPRLNVPRGLQAVLLVAFSVFVFSSYQFYSTENSPSFGFGYLPFGSSFHGNHTGSSNLPVASASAQPIPPLQDSTPPSPVPATGELLVSPSHDDQVFNSQTDKDGNATLLELAVPYIKSIMDPEDTTFPRLKCPRINSERYDYLREYMHNGSMFSAQYFIALDLHQNAELLPRLIGSIIEVIRFLGPASTSLSIVEGGSDDGTYEILKLLRKEMDDLGAKYFFVSSEINTREGDRIKKLAELRNLALTPLSEYSSHDTTVVFLNDVALCSDDILELVHQLIWQDADMTCAMDWTYVGRDPTFYDVWIARDIKGNTFFDIPADGNWNSAWNLFWNNEDTRGLYNSHSPFQVFSCWNGAVAFTAEALGRTKFRSSKPEECPGGEPKLFCTDLWAEGFGKIAVVPAVNLEYSDEAAIRIKGAKGFTGALVEGDENGRKIVWQEKPPEKVRCVPNYSQQSWRPWDEGL